VILVHDDGNIGVALHGRLDQVAQEHFAGIFAGARGRLHDHRAVRLGRGGHDGLHLLEVVDVNAGRP
jgi:hypothetical protein